MSKADEMFEEIGYKKDIDNSGHKTIYVDTDNGAYIEFDSKILCYVSNTFISIEELKAINAKVKELGWVENT